MARKVTLQQEQEIIELYKQGLSIKEIAEKYSLKWAESVTEIVKRNRVELRKEGSPRKFTYNTKFFSELNEQSCYWAGFIAADGCIIDTKPTKYLQIALKKIDLEHLEKFSKVINSTYNIKEDKVSFKVVIALEEETVTDLEKFGITPRKSLTFKPPLFLTDEQKVWFIRGYFDGDGTISFRRNKRKEIVPSKTSVGILGTLEMIEFYITQVNSQTGTTITASPTKRGNIFEIRNYVSIDNLKVLSWLYDNSRQDCRLDRKYEKYQQSKKALL